MPETLRRTATAARLALGRRGSLALVVGGGLAYLALYLYALGQLAVVDGGVGVVVFEVSVERALSYRGGLLFEPVARVDAGGLSLLVAPVNLAVGAVLGALVGLNLGVTHLVWRHPRACGVDPGRERRGSAGLVSGVPALLSGSACCGPTVAVALGLQVTGALLTAVQLLVPLAALGLVGSLAWVARGVEPAA